MYGTFLACLLIGLTWVCSAPASTVLITGANRGIGLEFARQYRAKGWNVIGTARRPERADQLRQLKVRVEQLDVTDGASVGGLADRLQGVPIDLVINNAGILRGRNQSLETLDFDDMALSFAVNSAGPVRVTQALLPNLRKGEKRQVVSITSQLGSITNNTGGMYAYRASKAALNQLNKSLSIELGRDGFTCVVIHPGWVRTDMGGLSATYTPERSVRSMIQVFDGLSPKDNGRFLTLTGSELPW